MSEIIIHSMDYVQRETNIRDWYRDFNLELDGTEFGFGEFVKEEDIETII